MEHAAETAAFPPDECQHDRYCLPGEVEDPFLQEVYGWEPDYYDHIALYRDLCPECYEARKNKNQNYLRRLEAARQHRLLLKQQREAQI